MADGKVDIGGWLTETWELYKANFGLMLVATLVAALLVGLTCGVLAGPMFAGLTLVILRVSRRSEPAPQIGDVFKGFDFFLQSLLLVVVLAVVYMALSFIPVIGGLAGLLISPLVMFAMPLVVSLLGSVISSLGALLCGIGVILTAPFGAILTVVAYRHMFEGVTAEPVPVADAASMDAPPPEPTQA